MKRIALLSLLAVCLILAPSFAKADQTTGKVSVGFEGVDVDDSKEGAGEFNHLEQGIGVTLDAEVDGWQKGIKYDAMINYTEEDEMSGALNLDVKRYFRTENSYQRFKHWLENDDLVNWNTDPDFAFPAMAPDNMFYTALATKAIMCRPDLIGANVAVAQHDSWGEDLHIIREEFTSKNEFLIPGAEFIKIHADYRRETRRGYEQGRTMNKCSGCHFYAEERRVNELTEDFKIGATAHLGLLTVDYTFFYREFDDRATAPTNRYDTASNSGGLADEKIIWDSADTFAPYSDGYIPYDATPESEKDSHIIKAQLALPLNTTILGSYVNTTVENKSATEYNHDYDNGAFAVSDDPEFDYDQAAFRLTSSPIKNLTVSMRYSHEELDSNTVEIDYDDALFEAFFDTGATVVDPATFGLHGYDQEHDGFPFTRESSLDRDIDTYGINLKYRLFARTNLLLGYEREEIDREDEALGETETDTFSIGINSRYFKNLSLRLKYQYQDIDEPFAHEGAALADAEAIGAWLAAEQATNPDPCPAAPYSSARLALPWISDATEYFVMYNSREATLTSEPENTHELTANATWTIAPKLSANVHFKYLLEEVDMDIPGFSNSYDKEMFSPGVDLWFAPTDRLVFTLAYQFQKMEDETFLSIPAYGG
ncbi:MAG: MtrB/PioB family outer membrane beta-barrel protein [Deltaproteobacteria bacterium]|nr:MtrB/PioB family outer membrane beta-barrel protein [Candidatus Anaeroferrophillus wilburensis]MBN2889031.1 MtrB/PioB family outer membrane beta-barrel protein [Deltaproteobacteria bacterium]